MPEVAEWRLDVSHLCSHERTLDGFLGVEYTDNVDTRWGDMRLGPLLTTIDCSAAGGTTANANGAAVAPASMQAAGPFLYVIRGTKWAKIKLADMSLVSDGTETALGEAATSILYTKSTNGTEEISIGMDNTAYEVITAVGSGATDTHSANNSSYKARVFGLAGASSATGQVAGCGRGTGSVMNVVAQNILSGSITMDAPNWQTRATFAGAPLTFTGFALDGNFWLIGTDDGLYYLDSDFQEFRPLIDELAQDDDSCQNMAPWSVLGPSVVVPLSRSTRISRYLSGESVGPEVYRENLSPVQGPATAFCASELWAYMPFYNPVTDRTYLCAVRPRLSGEWHSYPLSFFTIATLGAGKESRFGYYTGVLGGRTLPTVAIGSDSDVAWFSEGRLPRFVDDTSYQYAASGTAYLSELRRHGHYDKEPQTIEFEARGCSATETITVKLAMDGGTAVQIGAPVTKDGLVRLHVTTRAQGRRITPQVEFARGSTATAAPRIEGPLRLTYQLKDGQATSGRRA